MNPCPPSPSHADQWVHRAILLTLPWLIFLLNPNWMFQGFGPFDPWYYFGHFIHFPQYQQLMPTYAGERLPWILPGYALVHLLTPVYGTLALHLLAYYTAVFSLHSVIAHFAGRNSALLTACMLGCYPFFLDANGTDYVNGGYVAYCLLSFACLVRSVNRQSSTRWVFAAGMSWAATVYVYISWVAFTPACLIMYLAVEDSAGRLPASWRERLRHIAPHAAIFAAGGLALTCAMATAHALIFGESGIGFQRQSIRAVLAFAHLQKAQVGPDFRWSMADWMVFPALAAVLSLVLLLPRCRRWLELTSATGKLLLVYLYFFAIAVNMKVGQTRTLSYDVHASALLPGLFIVLGVSILAVPVRTNKVWFWLVLAAACTVSIAPLASPGLYSRPGSWAIALPGALLAGSISVRLIRPGVPALWGAGVVGLAAATCCLTPTWGGAAWRGTDNGMNATRRVGTAVRTIQSRLPADDYPAFWYNANSPHSAEYTGIMCAFLSHSFSMRGFPSVDAGRRYSPGQVILLLTDGREVFEGAGHMLLRAGMPVSLLWRQKVEGNGVSYWITATEVERDKEPVAGNTPVPVPLWEFEPGRTVPVGQSDSAFTLERWSAALAAPDTASQLTSDGLHVTTVKSRYGTALIYPVLTAPYDGVYEFRLTFRMLEGGLAFYALTPDQKSQIGRAGESEAQGASLVKSLVLLLGRGEQFRLVVANAHPTGAIASHFVIEGMSAFRL